MPTVSKTLQAGAETLREKGIAEPRRETASLLALALGRDNVFLIAHPEYELSEEEATRFARYLTRRAAREPLQYIRGTQEFYGLEFDVAPGVLIPRPETEILVEKAIGLIRDLEGPFICEVGTGSGCISVSILHEVTQAFAIGLDISDEALKVTESNARKNGVAGRLKLLRSDVYSALGMEKFDLLVSNPPYIPKADLEGLQAEVRAFEPAAALTDGGDGLSIIRKIVEEAPRHLRPGGFLLVEIGFDQAEKVREMFDRLTWQDVEMLPDLQSIPRVAKARLA